MMSVQLESAVSKLSVSSLSGFVVPTVVEELLFSEGVKIVEIETVVCDLIEEFKCNRYRKVLSEVEKIMLSQTMKKFKYNQAHAARHLDISRQSLRAKLEQYFGKEYSPRTLP